MPRKGPAPKRPLVVDPVYQSQLVTQLVNKVLVDGKRSIAEAIVYGAHTGKEQIRFNGKVAPTQPRFLVEWMVRDVQVNGVRPVDGETAPLVTLGTT